MRVELRILRAVASAAAEFRSIVDALMSLTARRMRFVLLKFQVYCSLRRSRKSALGLILRQASEIIIPVAVSGVSDCVGVSWGSAHMARVRAVRPTRPLVIM